MHVFNAVVLQKHSQPLDDVVLHLTGLDGAFENLLSGESVPSSLKAKRHNGSFQRASTELQQKGESLTVVLVWPSSLK